jgi:hypothetical protein
MYARVYAIYISDSVCTVAKKLMKLDQEFSIKKQVFTHIYIV